MSLDPHQIIQAFGPYATVGLLLVVFAETGLLFGFFLPGDSLLFTAGVLASQGQLNIAVICTACFAAAVVGDQVGYVVGTRAGPRLFLRPDSRLFKQEYVERTRRFFERHGPRTVVLARFVPIVRTFVPVLAGVARMRYRTFVTFNIIGGFAWTVGVIMAGYALSEAIGDSIDQYVLPIIAAIVVVSLIPPLLEARRHRRANRARPAVCSSPAVAAAPADAADAGLVDGAPDRGPRRP